MKPLMRYTTLPILSLMLFFALTYAVYADAAISIGVLGPGVPSIQTMLARFIVFVIVVLIEAAIFNKFLKVSWTRSLTASLVLNLVSTFAGLFWGGYRGYAMEYFFGYLIAGVICVIILRVLRTPWWYSLAAALAGLFGMFQLQVGYEPPQPPSIVALMLWHPIIFGFGTTLFAEGLFVRKLLPGTKPLGTLFTANVISYIFLALAIPLIASNPFGEINQSAKLVTFHSLLEKPAAGEAIEIFHQYHASNLYLLGITDNYQPPENYDAWLEITAISDWIGRGGYSAEHVDLHTALALVDDVLSYPGLTTEARYHLEYMRGWLTFSLNAETAIIENDQPELERIYNEWADFYVAEFLDAGRYGERLELMTIPDRLIDGMLMHYESDLTYTPRNWIEEFES